MVGGISIVHHHSHVASGKRTVAASLSALQQPHLY